MSEFNNAPEIKVGSVFYRVDRNGKEWTATVISRFPNLDKLYKLNK